MVKTIYFRRTNRGGGSQNNTRSKLVPVARVLQQRLLWLFGLVDDALNGKNIDHFINDITIEREKAVLDALIETEGENLLATV